MSKVSLTPITHAPDSGLTHPAVSGFATAHDGAPIHFEIHGDSPRTLLMGPGTVFSRLGDAVQGEIRDTLEQYKAAWLSEMTSFCSLLMIDYPGTPKPDTLKPDVVSRDYLAIVDAAGVGEFAYFGFSWGSVTGLQLALSTDRMQAFVAGGFPMVGGPYAQMLELSRNMAAVMPDDIAVENALSQQFVSYYDGYMQAFDDRAIQSQLTLPRLNWIGTADGVWNGDLMNVPSPEYIAEVSRELEIAGWDVQAPDGRDHLTSMEPGFVIPLVRAWLERNWVSA